MIFQPEDYLKIDDNYFSSPQPTFTKPFFKVHRYDSFNIHILGVDYQSNLNYSCFREEVVKKISNPEDWQFLLEASVQIEAGIIQSDYQVPKEGNTFHQATLMSAFAIDNNIPRSEFIAAPDDPRVIKEVVERSSREDFERFIVGKYITSAISRPGTSQESLAQVIKLVEYQFGIPQERFCEVFPPELASTYRESKHFLRMSILTTQSRNSVSEDDLVKIIVDNKKPDTFVHCGLKHLPILEEVIPGFEIPEEYGLL